MTQEQLAKIAIAAAELPESLFFPVLAFVQALSETPALPPGPFRPAERGDRSSARH